jgi:hypothetical protein
MRKPIEETRLDPKLDYLEPGASFFSARER